MPGLRLAVVEDEALIALDLRVRLSALGYEVTGIATSTAEALRLVERDGPDLVLMDIRLGFGDDGIEAAREIRRRHDCPILFLSAHSDDETLRRAWDAAPFGYILKPFRDRQLQIAIEIAVDKHRHEAELRRLNEALQRAQREGQLLRSLLPVCAGCKRIDDGEGAWCPVESYIQDRLEATVTHSLCPDCARTYFPDQD